MKYPNHAQKRIYWGKKPSAERGAAACILVGYCPDTLDYFLALYEEAKKSFPDLKIGDVTCGKVTQSSSVKSFTLIIFNIPGEKRTVDGWDDWDMDLNFNY